MLFLGIDLGTSSIKVSVVEANSQKTLCSVHYPETEEEIISTQVGWAEQSPEKWWQNTVLAIQKAHATKKYNPADIAAIGIAYQMHGLVVVDKQHTPLRNSIIWCDSRAVEIGNEAFKSIGQSYSLKHHLNSPGNFTASKLAWVKEHEPEVYEKIYKIMLPGDFIATKLTGEISSSISSLSEGVFWDFKNNRLSESILTYFEFEKSLLPEVKPVFSEHGKINSEIAKELGLSGDVKVTYKAGDQPNNALSLNVLEPGEVASTAGTSGVIYGVSDQLVYDNESRINTFAHVNYLQDKIRTGVLLCINGTGILYSWAKKLLTKELSYPEMNKMAQSISTGSNGLRVLPFGNGAERMLNNKLVGAHIENIDLNQHGTAHILKAMQEGIAFSFRYGLDIMKENGLDPKIIKAGNSNLFLSEVFQRDYVNATGVPVELYENDGSVGAALGAGIGLGYYKTPSEAFKNIRKIKTIEPDETAKYEEIYQEWKELQLLNKKLKAI
ncbi:Carbohydrate kinase, FGGY [Pseudopedobacter saltans DSM 12145]|uniref:Carbohydrate kinase, FGGY n=1 Tax=Pseudopedobacter saltans (strain ATCC 51119 / DSM 12145 / JCM 21818 / CCUG 39354 / LMG 10337 / NBRC 100064 / NCIMB 13643) TaxID=762903 RepID=F0SCN5_PSESL|nr:FGGY family carbohydrate kinase [Pseudopedobacter saltans]ADY53879.1 Carbohydrate kinase, FGGY [Pseudopedobacter saltans DSM 12145]